ncbi:DNA gyrase subunit B [Streptomyces sp. NPDC090085]|uniref:DNA gyrase subunit B n=1 Tax=Streptomyces sp. NPDC090085 TaxID=3365943 RepID=UPI003821C855
MSEESTSYDASNIQVLVGWEAVRKRPGMYICSTSERGLRHMVFEIADRATNELDGRATSVDVTLTPDGGVYVADDGPGVPIDEPGTAGGPRVEALLTQMQAGTRFAGRHDITLGFCGVGPAVVNALSQRMTAEVRREGVRWVQEYARGVATTPLTEAGTATESVTTIAFWPDADVFGAAEFPFDGLEERFRELAFLNQGLEISLTDLRHPDESRSVRFRFPGRARDLVAFLDGHAAASAPMDTIAFEYEDPRMAGGWRWPSAGADVLRSGSGASPTAGPPSTARTRWAFATG